MPVELTNHVSVPLSRHLTPNMFLSNAIVVVKLNSEPDDELIVTGHGNRKVNVIPMHGLGVITALVIEPVPAVVNLPPNAMAQLCTDNGVLNVKPPAGNDAVIAPAGETVTANAGDASPAAMAHATTVASNKAWIDLTGLMASPSGQASGFRPSLRSLGSRMGP